MNNYIDRGTKKWSMAMMLPEHVELLRKLEYEDSKVQKPILDQQELEEIERTISEALNNKSLMEFTYWREGFILKKQGYVQNFNQYQNIIQLIDLEEIKFGIKIDTILVVSLTDK